MIKVNKALLEVEGDSILISTEAAMLLTEIRRKDKTLLPVVLSCVYSHGGANTLEETLKAFKEDTESVLKQVERMEKAKNG